MPKLRIVDYQYDDGGRKETGRKGRAGDCAVRATAIASHTTYDDMYENYAYMNQRHYGKRSARDGMPVTVSRHVLRELGFQDMEVRLNDDITITQAYEQFGDCIVNIPKHMLAVMNGAVHDTWDSRFIRKRKQCWQPAVLRVYAHPDNNGPIPITNVIDDPTTEGQKKTFICEVFDNEDDHRQVRCHAIRAFNYDHAKKIVNEDFQWGYDGLHVRRWQEQPAMFGGGFFKATEQFTITIKEDT